MRSCRSDAPLDLKFRTGTYAGIRAERLESELSREIGVFSAENATPPFIPAATKEHLDYTENSLAVNLNQLAGEYFVLGADYRVARAELEDVLPGVDVSILPAARQDLRALLHEAGGYILFNHPCGFFARAETRWYHQSNSGYDPALAGDDFVMENVFLGWRFARRHVELLFGVLNLSDQDYHLNPLTLYAELPRERTFIARLKFQF